jgi:hypothetical protein
MWLEPKPAMWPPGKLPQPIAEGFYAGFEFQNVSFLSPLINFLIESLLHFKDGKCSQSLLGLLTAK